MQEMAAEYAGKTVFSTLDLQDGYWQVELDEESSLLCTFSTPHLADTASLRCSLVSNM